MPSLSFSFSFSLSLSLSSTLYFPPGQEDFTHIMKNLPVPVLDEDVEEMFTFADTDGDGRLSYQV